MSALLSIPFFGSELILVVSFFIAMALDFAFSDKKWVAYFTLAALALAWWFGPPAGASVRLFFGSFVWDPVTHFFKGLIYGTIGLTVIASLAYEQIPGRIRGEFYMLLVALALTFVFFLRAPVPHPHLVKHGVTFLVIVGAVVLLNHYAALASAQIF